MNLAQALSRIDELTEECRNLRARLNFLEYQPKISDGLKGELLISQAVDGILTLFTAGSDVVIPRTGLILEVKFSNLSDANRAKIASTKRWTWPRPLGQNETKKFDRLILVGVTDHRYQQSYLEKTHPYVFFDVPFAAAASLARKSGTHQNIQISTNPLTARTDVADTLFKKYQVSFQDLTRKYGLAR